MAETEIKSINNKPLCDKTAREELSKLSEDKADKSDTYTKAEVDAKIQNVPSGGNSVPNVGKFIGEVTIDNDETRIVEWTQCADGSPLDFDELLFIVKGKADSSRNLGFTTNNQFSSSAYNWSAMSVFGFNQNELRYCVFHFKMIGGRWFEIGTSNSTSEYAQNVQRSFKTSKDNKGTETERCTTSLVVGLGWGHFLNGTEIAVYGR